MSSGVISTPRPAGPFVCSPRAVPHAPGPVNVPSRIACCVATALCAAGCVPVDLSAKLGYAETKVGGRLALDSSGGGQPVEQGVDSAFGLGDARGSPFVRGRADFGGPVVTGSALWLRESGRGQLADSFGGLPGGTQVESRLDLGLAKLSAAWEFDVGPLRLGPGVLFDVFALDFSARELVLNSREIIDEVLFVPMPFLRAEGCVGSWRATAEVGWLEVSDLGDTEGRFVDVEAIVEWSPVPHANLFAGYRFLGIDGSGDTGTETFAADLRLRGWTIGGGIRF